MGSIARYAESTKLSVLKDVYSQFGTKTEEDHSFLVDQVIRQGITNLEDTLEETWKPKTSLAKNTDHDHVNVPIVFNAAAILDILLESGVQFSDDFVHRAVTCLQQENIQRKHTSNICDQDISENSGDSLNVICSLYALRGISYKEATSLTENMVTQLEFNGVGNTLKENLNEDCLYVWPEWKNIRQVDTNVAANVLYCMGRLNLIDSLNGEKFDACFDVINDVLSDMLIGKKGNYVKNCTDFDVTLFLISRVVRYSEKAMILFGNKVETLVRRQFGRDNIAFHVGCRILAAVNLEMLEIHQDLIVKEAMLLIRLKDTKDSTWPECTCYGTNGNKKFGSKAATTGIALAALQHLRLKLLESKFCGNKFDDVRMDSRQQEEILAF